MVTIKDVAKHSGVSVSTVSIVLNGKERERKLSPNTVAQVRASIAELGYRPNRAARTLRSGNVKPVIALFWVLNARSTLFMRLVRGLGMILKQEDFPCELVIHPYQNGKLLEQAHLLQSSDYQGILIGALNEQDLDDLNTLQISSPLIVINRHTTHFPCCYTDPAQVGELTTHFAREHDFNTLGIAAERTAVMPKTTRRNHVISACAEIGISCPESHIVACDNSIVGGIEAAHTLLDYPSPPDIIYADNDIVAMGVSLAARMRGLTDFPILCTCLNHPDFGQHTRPKITMIDIPGEELGRASASMMVQWLKTGTLTQREHLCSCHLLCE